MKQKRILAVAAITATLGAVASGANAENLGEVWVGDQQNGLVYIADQDELNNPYIQATVDVVDLKAQVGHASDRMHIIGFSNHSGLDPASRAIFSYLDGYAEVWQTNGGTHMPTKLADLQVLGGGVGRPDAPASLHMCGPSPDNSMIACSSIGGRKAIIYSADMATDIYTRLGDFDLNPASIPFSRRLKGRELRAVQDQMAAINAVAMNPSAICNNFDSTSSTLYYTVQTTSSSGGVMVLDVNDPANPTIVDAFAVPFADGCGLVNSPDGKYMWINHGHNTAGDNEMASKWSNLRYVGTGRIKQVGPVATVDIPEKQVTVDGRSGDVHGAQFAGVSGAFLWEVMRIDDVIHVIQHNSGNPRIVNTIDLEAIMGIEAPQADVLDRSATGKNMYFSTRGFIPVTAIKGFIDLDRDPGIVTLSTFSGFDGAYVKTTSIRTGTLVYLCAVEDDGHGDHDHDTPIVCEDQSGDDLLTLGLVDNVDPHGLKSLSYISGGF